MREKIGKRIGPVPITLVAVFALAAFLSAGFLLAPNSAQAQEGSHRVKVTAPAGTTLGTDGMRIDADDVVEIDVSEAVTVNLSGTFAEANDSYSYTVYWDDVTVAAGVQPVNIENTFNGSNTTLTVIPSGQSTFTLTPGTVQESGGESINRTATVRIEAGADANDDSAAQIFEFKVNVVENPIEINGVMVENPNEAPANTSVEWPDDGACEIYFTSVTELLSRRSVTAVPGSDRMVIDTQDAGLGKLVSAGACATSEDTVAVSFINAITENSAPRTLVVYVTGGDDFADVEPAVGAQGLNEEIVKVAAHNLGDNGKETVEVSRSMANSDGIVYLIGYSGTPDVLTNARLDDEDSTTFNRNAEFVVKAVFLDPPVEKDANDKVVSKIDIPEVPRNDEEVMATITIKDANGHPVPGFVNLTVEGGASVVFTDSSLKTHRAKLEADGMVEAEISGLPKTGPFKIKVTAEASGLTLEKNVVRKGDATMVEATAYACEEDSDDEDEGGGVCASEIVALKTKPTSDDPDEVVALGPDDSFVIGAKATDAAGNTVSSLDELSWKITSSADNADDAEDTLTSNNGDSLEEITIAGSDDAVPGVYSLTVTSSDGDASTIIMITVSDVASMIMVSCDPMMIPIDTGLTDCTVTVTDANGNIPSNLHEDEKADGSGKDMVRVAIRSRDVQIIGVDNNHDTELDDEGMATFSVLLREDATEGTSITVSVSTSAIGGETLRANTTVTYGMAQPEMMAPGMPMNVMAEATSDTMITVSWESPADDGGSDITGYMVQRAYRMSDGMMSDWMDVDPAHMGMDMMYMDMGLMAETTYYYRVAAMNAEGTGAYSDGTAMATTMMATTTMDELGTVTDVITGFNRGGALQVSWTKAANASGYIIIAINVNDVNRDVVAVVLNDGDLDTRNISGLTPGATYDIYVAATASGGKNTLSDAARVTAK